MLFSQINLLEIIPPSAGDDGGQQAGVHAVDSIHEHPLVPMHDDDMMTGGLDYFWLLHSTPNLNINGLRYNF